MGGKCVAVIVKDDMILMERVLFDGRYFYTLPGGTIEEGETPEEAVVREVKEECNLDVRVIRPISTINRKTGKMKYSFECEIIGDKEPTLGKDPEFPDDEQSIKEVLYMRLEDIDEKDRAFLWSEGLMEVGNFADVVIGWGDEISFPGKS